MIESPHQIDFWGDIMLCFDQIIQIFHLLLIGITIFFLWMYTRATIKLRKEASSQTKAIKDQVKATRAQADEMMLQREMMIEPYVSIRATEEKLYLENIGQFNAVDISIDPIDYLDFKMKYLKIPFIRAGGKEKYQFHAVYKNTREKAPTLAVPIAPSLMKERGIEDGYTLTIHYKNVHGTKYLTRLKISQHGIDLIAQGKLADQ